MAEVKRKSVRDMRGPGWNLVEDENPLRRCVANRFDLVVSFILGAFFAAIHASTSCFWVFPGDSARWAATIADIYPSSIPSNQLFVGVFRFLSGLAGEEYRTAAAAIWTLFFSSVNLMLTNLIVVALLRLMMDLVHLRATVANGAEWGWRTPRIAGAAATIALGFSAPFWTAATRVNPDTFHFTLVLLSSYLLILFIATDSIVSICTSAILYGMLCTQSPVALQFLPLFVAGLAIAAFRSEHGPFVVFGSVLTLAAFSAAATAAFCVVCFSKSEVFGLLRYGGKIEVIWMLVSGILTSVVSSVSRLNWFFVVLTTALPFYTVLTFGRLRLDGSRSATLRFLDIAIFFASVLVLSCSAFSPWGLFGFRAEQCVGYAMASIVFGYCIASANQQTLFLFFPLGQPPFPGAKIVGKAVQCVIFSVAAVLLALEARTGLSFADTRPAKFLCDYVDDLIDGLEGRDLLVTDFILEDIVRIRAKERGLSISAINLADSSQSANKRLLREKLEDSALRNAFDLGMFQFVREYISRFPEARQRLALGYFPDLWNLGPWRGYPHGLAFVGVPENAPHDDPLGKGGVDPVGDDVKHWLSVAASLDESLTRVKANSSRELLACARIVRQRVSFIGNNLAYWLDVSGRDAEALELWRQVNNFDPSNLSTLLNLYSSLDRAGLKKEQEAVGKKLEAFRAKAFKPVQIWELSRSQGYVANPDAFASLGLSWALTGQTDLALRTLRQAIDDGIAGRDSHSGASPLMLALGAIYEGSGFGEKAADVFKAELAKNPENQIALSGLFNAMLSSGDFSGAEKLLETMENSGLPSEKTDRARIQLLLSKDDPGAAVAAAKTALNARPDDPDLCLMLFGGQMALAEKENQTGKTAARSDAEKTAEKLCRDPAVRPLHGAIAMASLHMADGDWAQARRELLMAEKSLPGSPAILNRILQLDYALEDKVAAETHARQLLETDPNHGFANYIMGSLCLLGNQPTAAVAFLERSCEAWDGAPPRADLAYALWLTRSYDKSEKLAREALHLAPNTYEAWDTLGLDLIALKRPDEALDAFSHAIKLKGDDKTVHLHRARALLDTGNAEAARSVLFDLQDEQPHFPPEDRAFYDSLAADIQNALVK